MTDPTSSARPARPASRHCAALAAALAVGLVTLTARPAAATETRALSLGGDADYFEDLSGVLRWYGSLPSYTNTAIVELGRLDGSAEGGDGFAAAAPRGAGAHADLDTAGSWGTIGLYLFRDQNPLPTPGARVLMYGRAWGGGQAAVLLGQSERGATRLEAGVEDQREKSLDLFLGVGARCDLGPRTYLDAAGEWRRSRLEYLDRAARLDLAETGWGSFGLRARVFHELGGAIALVPAASYLRDDRAGLIPGEDLPGRLDAWTTRLGLGVNVFPGGDVMGVGSVEWRRGAERWRLTTLAGDADWSYEKFDVLVARLGVEGRLRSWLTLRAGVVSAPSAGDWPRPANFGLARDFELTLGLGLHLGSLDADLAFADEAPFNLGSIVTNAGGEQRSSFTSVSLAYAF